MKASDFLMSLFRHGRHPESLQTESCSAEAPSGHDSSYFQCLCEWESLQRRPLGADAASPVGDARAGGLKGVSLCRCEKRPRELPGSGFCRMHSASVPPSPRPPRLAPGRQRCSSWRPLLGAPNWASHGDSGMMRPPAQEMEDARHSPNMPPGCQLCWLHFLAGT